MTPGRTSSAVGPLSYMLGMHVGRACNDVTLASREVPLPIWVALAAPLLVPFRAPSNDKPS